METVKSIFKSRTFWFNVLCAAVGTAQVVGAEQLSELGINGVAQKWALVILGGVSTIGNIYLRSITNAPVITPLTKTKP